MYPSLAQPELYLPKSPDRDYSTYFEVDPMEKYRPMNEFCKSARVPSDLNAHTKAQIDCGWYYYADPSMPSIGILGTREGPLFTDNVSMTGVWTWDLKKAQKMEEIKFCKRASQCFMVDLDTFKGRCGFCKTKGFSVPITPSGEEKYIDADTDFCGKPLITKGEMCAGPASEQTTLDGSTCGTYGTPSEDNRLRMYTPDDCQNLGGIYNGDGVCLLSDGEGSFNVQCAQLNMPSVIYNTITVPGLTPTTTGTGSGSGSSAAGGGMGGFSMGGGRAFSTANQDVCAPNIYGRLSAKCLLSIAKGLGFSDKGAICTALSTGQALSDDAQICVEILTDGGINIPNGILGAGDIDKVAAGNAFNAIYNAMNFGGPTKPAIMPTPPAPTMPDTGVGSGSSSGALTISAAAQASIDAANKANQEALAAYAAALATPVSDSAQRIRGAARLLVNGDLTFDPCAISPSSTNPVPLVCLQREFRKAGCQAAGILYPTKANSIKYVGQSFGSIQNSFRLLQTKMNSATDREQQFPAVANCLGVKYAGLM